MRICSLLPSITETLFELGLGNSVVAVTHECDWPPEARTRTPVTRSRIRVEDQSSAQIDQQVREHDGSLYDLDADALARLRPDLILTQSLCPVCAVDETTVRQFAKFLPGEPRVFSYHPTRLADVLAMIQEIGALTDAQPAARRLTDRFGSEIERIRAEVAGLPVRPGVVCLEWIDPLFACGHWTPELVEAAGGCELLGRVGQPSRRASQEELVAANPDVVLIAPCGFDLVRTVQEAGCIDWQTRWGELSAVRTGRVFATDGSAYFNCPGPRLIESLQILAEVLHPERFAGLAPAHSFQRIHSANRM
ncbi:MAG: cobalamin-binding protein [Planctomycetes bacterium]|nr:cobalamin-binding protein [Planctomycetota bacterium]